MTVVFLTLAVLAQGGGVHSMVEHPNQEGDTYCCARTTALMAESV